VIDVGAGTGISTRLLRRNLDAPVTFVGVDVSADMLREAVASTEANLRITYVRAHAEHLPFQDSSAVAIVAAQAVQWFDRPSFYSEALRVLHATGTLALLQNNRDWQQSKFLDAYEALLESAGTGYCRSYRDFDYASELRTVTGLEVVPPVIVAWERKLTVEEFIGMSLSSTKVKAVVLTLGEQRAVSRIRELAERYSDSKAIVRVPYQSELYLARRTSATFSHR
jgi:SAM-dependent methyltransferase